MPKTKKPRPSYTSDEAASKIPLKRRTIRHFPEDFRVGALISDGQFMSIPKWCKSAAVSEEYLRTWIDKALTEGRLSRLTTGAKSYYMNQSQLRQWYRDHRLQVGCQLLDYVFPARIWGGMTEVEGFMDAPVRRIGIVTVQDPDSATRDVIKKATRGWGKVREEAPGVIKIHCLSQSYGLRQLTYAFNEAGLRKGANYANMIGRGESKRRESCDFDREFFRGLMDFYVRFAKSILRPQMETIRIFLPGKGEQEAQIVVWIIQSLERYDAKTGVPFSGYLQVILSRWPYDLPTQFLGKEIADFQRQRSRAIKVLTRYKNLPPDERPTREEIIEEMNISEDAYNDLEHRHQTWLKVRSAGSLVFDETNEERLLPIHSDVSPQYDLASEEERNLDLAYDLSYALIVAAVDTKDYESAWKALSLMDSVEIDEEVVKQLSPEFVAALGQALEM